MHAIITETAELGIRDYCSDNAAILRLIYLYYWIEYTLCQLRFDTEGLSFFVSLYVTVPLKRFRAAVVIILKIVACPTLLNSTTITVAAIIIHTLQKFTNKSTTRHPGYLDLFRCRADNKQHGNGKKQQYFCNRKKFIQISSVRVQIFQQQQ